MSTKNNLIFVVGPTATGKTEVSIALAKKLNADIVSADSMLIYQEPEIITAKPSPKILNQIPHHFVNIVSVTQMYNVFEYYQQASDKIKELLSKNTPVIVCGGTGLYVKALLDGIFEGVGKDSALRLELGIEVSKFGVKHLHDKLKQVDSEAAEKISENDVKRVIRALEVYYITGVPISEKQKQRKGLAEDFSVKVFGLTFPRETLYQRINQRVDEMFKLGAVDEVKNLLSLPLSITADKIIGVNEIRQYLDGKITLEQAKEDMKRNTRRFAKRQLTWFRKDPRVCWVDVDKVNKTSLSEELQFFLQACP